jgi:O-antigen/teichoic acid export membrane protein
MSIVKRNVLANLLGGGWLMVLTVAITPMQVNLLGIEAYGIVAFISTLQVAFTAVEMGLSSTLTRELAADCSASKRDSNDLIRTASTLYWLSAGVMGVALFLLAGPMVQRWFNASALDPQLIERSLQVIAFYLALRWPVSLYTGLLTGLQRMDVLNVVKVSTATLRLAGGIAVLALWQSLYAFLLWTALNALIEVVAFGVACRRAHPTMPWRPGIAWSKLKQVWRFSVSMNALSILALLIVQMDRLLISKMLTLEELGYYNLAITASSVISLTVAAVSTAVLPSLAAAYGHGTQDELARRCDRADRLMLGLVSPVAFALIFYSEPILSLWINPEAAAEAARPLSWLAAGFWCSAVIANVYNVAVACGVPGRHLRINAICVIPYTLGLYLLIDAFGITGAAVAWLLLNIIYGCLLVVPIHHRLLGISTLNWLRRIVLPFFALSIAAFMLPRLGAEFLGLERNWPAHSIPLLIGLLLQLCGSIALLDLRKSDLPLLRTLLAGMKSYARSSKS